MALMLGNRLDERCFITFVLLYSTGKQLKPGVQASPLQVT